MSSNSRRGRRFLPGGWTGRILLGALVLLLALILPRIFLGAKAPVVRPERRTLAQKVVANGRVYVPNRAQLGTMVSGIVARVLVDEGARIHAGDVLIELDDAEARAGVGQAAAHVQQIREVDTRTSAEDLRQAEATLSRSEQEFRRTQALFDSQAVAVQQLDRAREDRDLAQSRRDAARARLRSKNPGGSDLRAAEADLALAQARLAQTRVVAPTDGTILKRQVQPGDVVQPGQILLIMAEEGETYLLVEPEEKNLSLLRNGQEALASSDAFPGRTFPARIIRIAPSVDQERGTVEVRLLVPDPPDYLRPDMTVSVEIEVGRRENALVLPSDAVRDPESSRPWVLLARGGRAVRQPVTLGLRGDGRIEIASGIAESDRIVPASAARIRPGLRIRPVKQAPEGL